MRCRSLAAWLGLVAWVVPASAARADGLTWDAPQPVDTAQSPEGVGAFDNGSPLGVDDRGRAQFAWLRGSGDAFRTTGADAPAGGPFGSARPLTPAAPGDDAVFRLAVNERGDALLTWLHIDGDDQTIFAARRPAGGDYGAPIPVESDSDVNVGADRFDADLGDDGTAVVVYQPPLQPGVRAGTFARVSPPGAPFGPAEQLGDASTSAGDPGVAVDPRGNAVAGWSFSTDPSGNKPGKMQAATYAAAAGAWDSTRDVTPIEDFTLDSQGVAVDDRGDAALVWTRRPFEPNPLDPAPDTVMVARRIAGGSWGDEGQLSDPARAATVVGVVGGPDRFLVDWLDTEVPQPVSTFADLQVTEAGADESFGPVRRLSTPGTEASGFAAAFGPGGRAVMAWTEQTVSDSFKITSSAFAAYRPADGDLGATQLVASVPSAGLVTTGAGLTPDGALVSLDLQEGPASTVAVARGTVPGPRPSAGSGAAPGSGGSSGAPPATTISGATSPLPLLPGASAAAPPRIARLRHRVRMRRDGTVVLGRANNPPTAEIAARLIAGTGGLRAAAARRTTVGRGRLRVPAGASRRLSVRLVRRARRALRRPGAAVRARATLVLHGTDGTRRTLHRSLVLVGPRAAR